MKWEIVFKRNQNINQKSSVRLVTARFAYYERLHARTVALRGSVNGVFLILLELSEINFVCCYDDATNQNDNDAGTARRAIKPK